ncbi:MAG: hypothetical protein RIC85_04940 [Gammaproteobacteria bacterium]
MNWEAFGAIAEFLGGGAVVVSLIYLALQARQSAQLERSENYGRIVEVIAHAISKLSTNRDLTELVIAGSVALDELDETDRVRFSFVMFEIFGNYEFVYEQSREKALPDHVWPHYLQHLEYWASMPGVRDWWKSRRAVFSAGFMEAAAGAFEKPGFSKTEAREVWRNF